MNIKFDRVIKKMYDWYIENKQQIKKRIYIMKPKNLKTKIFLDSGDPVETKKIIISLFIFFTINN
mgnify:CR=1 FL=1